MECGGVEEVSGVRENGSAIHGYLIEGSGTSTRDRVEQRKSAWYKKREQEAGETEKQSAKELERRCGFEEIAMLIS